MSLTPVCVWRGGGGECGGRGKGEEEHRMIISIIWPIYVQPMEQWNP